MTFKDVQCTNRFWNGNVGKNMKWEKMGKYNL